MRSIRERYQRDELEQWPLAYIVLISGCHVFEEKHGLDQIINISSHILVRMN